MMSPISYSLKGASTATGMSESTLDRAIKAGRLRAKKSSVDADGNPSGSYVITAEALQAWIESLADA